MEHISWILEPVTLFAIIIGIIVFAKIIAHGIRVVDVLMYIILWFIFSLFVDFNSDANNLNYHILEFLSEIWVIFLMFYAWWNEDSKTFIKKVLENKWVAIIWAVGPFIWAYLSTEFLWFTFNEWIIAWFIFTATAVPYTVLVLQSLKLDKTPASKSIVAAAMADDFISIITMSAVFSTFIAMQSWENTSMINIVSETWLKLLYLLLCFLVFILLAKYIFPHKSYNYHKKKWLPKAFAFISEILWLKWFTKKFNKVEILIPTVIFIIFFLSFFSHLMWLHAAIWAYLTWLILNNDMFHHGDEDVRNIDLTWVMYSLANHFLWPIFFIYLWVSLWSWLSFNIDTFSTIFYQAFIIFIVVAIFQFISASLAAKYTAWLSYKDSILVWLGMLPRDVLAFVILWIAFEKWLTTNTDFMAVIIIAIILLDIATPLVMKYWSIEYNKIK